MMQDQNKCVMTLERPGIIYWGKMLLVFEKKKEEDNGGGRKRPESREKVVTLLSLARAHTASFCFCASFSNVRD